MKQFLILAITLSVLTFVVIIANPSPRKEVQIVNTEYRIKQQDINKTETKTTKIENKNIVQNKPVTVNTVSTQTTTKNVTVQPKTQPSTKKTVTSKNINSNKNIAVKTTTTKPVTTPKTVTVQKTTVKTVATQPQKATPTTVTKTTPKKPPETPTQTAEQKAAQEAISWNKWRANVHNQIISQVNMPTVPSGTKFTYSFTVTKDGTISNIKTTSVAPQYTAYAIQYLAPVIRRSAHASFLHFPNGTERTVVDVKYNFITTQSGSGTQANANNFNDVELIKK